VDKNTVFFSGKYCIHLISWRRNLFENGVIIKDLPVQLENDKIL
jgi:hypothetical protein